MPELPEVEIVKQSLIKKVKGHKINKVKVYNKNLRFKLENTKGRDPNIAMLNHESAVNRKAWGKFNFLA